MASGPAVAFVVAALAWIYSWMHEQTIASEAPRHGLTQQEFVTRAVLRARFRPPLCTATPHES